MYKFKFTKLSWRNKKTHKPAVAKHTDAMPCQQRTKKKEVYFNRQLTSGSAFSLSYPFILKQLSEHELSVSFKKRHGKWARIGQMDTTAKHLLQNKHAHPLTLKAIQLNAMQSMQTQKLHFPIRQLGLWMTWHTYLVLNTGALSCLLSLPPNQTELLVSI